MRFRTEPIYALTQTATELGSISAAPRRGAVCKVRADIQGLRALAVLSVIAFHYFPAAITGGYVGVDIFFVISGYVIGRSVISDSARGRFSLSDFYERRARRILPALTLLCFAVLAVGFLLFTPRPLWDLGRSIISVAFFSSNMFFLHQAGYFDSVSVSKPMLHTWSLAVEEQFYFVFPCIILLTRKFAKEKSFEIISTIFVISLLYSVYLVNNAPASAYYLSPSRGYELLLGAMLASRLEPNASYVPPRTSGGLSLAGLLLVGLPVVLYTPETPFPGVAALVPCAGAALIILTGAQKSTLGGRAISSGFFVFLGDISYSLYLWHWPVLVYAKCFAEGRHDWAVAGVSLVLTFGFAYLSFRLVEKPLLTRPIKSAPWLTIGAATIAATTLAAAPFVLYHGFPGRFSSSAQDAFLAANDFNHKKSECHNEGSPLIPFEQNCLFGDTKAKPEIAVWGDSHGTELVMPLGDDLASTNRSVMEITSSACPPSLDFYLPGRRWCIAQNAATLKALSAASNIKSVILVTNFHRYQDAASLTNGFARSVKALLAAHKHVVVLLPIPVMDFNPPETVGTIIQEKRDVRPIGLARSRYNQENEEWIAFIRKLAEGRDMSLLDPTPILCDRTLCSAVGKDRMPLYFDADHLTLRGVRVVADELVAMLPKK